MKRCHCNSSFAAILNSLFLLRTCAFLQSRCPLPTGTCLGAFTTHHDFHPSLKRHRIEKRSVPLFVVQNSIRQSERDDDYEEYSQSGEYIDDDGFYDSVELSDEEMKLESMEDVLKKLVTIGTTGPAQSNEQAPPYFLKNSPSDSMLELLTNMENLQVDSADEVDLSDDAYGAPYLDADAYTNYLSNLNPDGSISPPSGGSKEFLSNARGIRAIMNSKPEVPDSYYTTTTTSNHGKEASLEDLYRAAPHGADAIDEDLHRQIMEEEQGFLKQSELFQEYLLKSGTGAGATEGQDAVFKLKDQRREREKADLILKLEQEMNEFVETIDKQPSKLDIIVCSKCGCPLSPIEIETGPQDRTCQVCFGDVIAKSSDMRFLEGPPSTEYRRGMINRTLKARAPLSPPRTPSASSPNAVADTLTSKGSPATRKELNTTPGPAFSTPQRAGYARRMDIPQSLRSRQASFNQGVGAKGPSDISSVNPPKSTREDELYRKRAMAALQQQVEKYKRQLQAKELQLKAAEVENARLRSTIEHLEQRLFAVESASESNNGVEPETAESWMDVLDPETGEVFYWNEETGEMTTNLDDELPPFKN